MRPAIFLLTVQLLTIQMMIVRSTEVAFAQAADPGSPAAAQNKPAALPSVSGAGSDVVIRTATGELIPLSPLLGKGIVEELLQRAQEQRNIPRYTIAQMEVRGTINRDEVQLSVELQIQVNAESEWVTVPLAFGDVYLTKFSSTSDVAEGQALLTSGEQNSRRWYLRGKGLHTVKMDLVGKPRIISPGVSQLNLTLPSATASHSVLTFSLPVELQKLPSGAVDKAIRNEQGVNQVELWGLPASFSLTWSEVVTRVAQKPVIQVQNRLRLDLTTIPVTLTGTQNLQISGSPVSEVNVTFPQGFELVGADARNAAGVSVLKNFESPPTSGPVAAAIRLTSAMEGSLTLSFDLELTNRQFPLDIKVSLPSIKDVNQQSGDLEILSPTGLPVEQTEQKGVQRIRVPSESDLSVAATAFRMRSPESWIVMHVEETEPQFAVSPELSLQPNQQNVLVTTRYPVSVLKGSLLDLSIVWPGYSGGEWQILPGTMVLINGKTNLPLPLTMKLSESEADVLQLTFPERQSGEFVVEFRAFASLPSVRSGDILLRCPEVQKRQGQPFVLTTIESDEYLIRPISTGTGELLPTVPIRVPASSDDIKPGLNSESWLHDDPTVPIRLQLAEQAPSVRAEITLGLQPRENGIEVQESIRFEIEHRDMTILSLKVPAGIRPTVRVAEQAEALRATIESSNWNFRLPEPRRGSLSVDVTYLWLKPPDAASSVNDVYQLPIILPQSAEVRSVRTGTSSHSGLKVSGETNWSPVYSERFESAMETTQPVVSVPLQWEDRDAAASYTASPDLIFAQTRIIGRQVITSTLAAFDSLPETVSVETPRDIGIEAILLGGKSLTAGDADKTIIRLEGIPDRDVNRWIISAGKVSGAQNGPAVLEFRVREKLPEKPALWLRGVIRRAVVVGELSAVPVVWCVGSQDEFQAVPASMEFFALTHRSSALLTGGETARTIADRQLQAVLSPYTADLQLVMMERADEWLGQQGRQDLFFGSADSGALKLYLVPQVSLLLVSALSCVAFFLLMSIFRHITFIVPALFFCCLGLVAWLIFPERTLMLAPYAGMGMVFGIVSVIFQRRATDRRQQFSGSPRANNALTVFGFSGVLSPPQAESGESALLSATHSSEVSVSSAR